jgi:Dimerisation domain
MAIQPRAVRTADDAPGGLSLEAILQRELGSWGSKTVRSAVELGIFSELVDGPLAGEELAARLELHPRSWRAFLDALVALGMLARDDGTYHNTHEIARLLDRAKPPGIVGILEMNAHLEHFWG